MNKTASVLITMVLVILVIASVYGLYSGGLGSVESALIGDDDSIADNAQSPGGSSYESPDPTSSSTRFDSFNPRGVQNG